MLNQATAIARHVEKDGGRNRGGPGAEIGLLAERE